MGVRISENLYEEYGVPTLDLVFTQSNNGLLNVVDNGQIAVEFSRTQDTQASYYKSDGIIGYAATDVPRFDHDPVTGESLGLLIEEERTNFCQQSSLFSNSYWIKDEVTVTPNAITAPDGTLTAEKITPNATTSVHKFRRQGMTVNDSRVSVYVKYAGWQYIAFLCNINQDTYGVFDLLNGTASLGEIEDVGNGWFRIISSQYPGPGNTNNTWTVSFSDNFIPTLNDQGGSVGLTLPGDGISGAYFWGFQAEEGSFPTSHIPTPATFTSRASNATYYDQNGIVSIASTDVARDDAYLPDENGNFISAGLLLEDTATNNIIYSGLSTTSNWATDFLGTTTEVSGLTGPFDTATLFEVTGTGGDAGRIYYSSAPNGGDFQVGDTVSVFVKLDTDPTGTSTIMFRSSTQGSQAKFTIATETTTVTGSSWENPSFQKLSGGWYRFSADWINASAGTSPRIWISDTTSVIVTSPGTKMYVKGFQSENSSYATSYIPTTSGISTRAADISSSNTSTRGADTASITGAGFSSFYNQSEGSLFSQYVPSGGHGSVTFWDGIGSRFNYWEVNAQSTAGGVFGFLTRSNQGTNSGTFNKGRIEDSTNYGFVIKHAAAIADNDFACYTSSSSGDTTLNTGSTIPATGGYLTPLVDRLTLTDSLTGVMRLSRLTYWPRRLPDSDLQRLTE
jgi:hypothetical protein